MSYVCCDHNVSSILSHYQIWWKLVAYSTDDCESVGAGHYAADKSGEAKEAAERKASEAGHYASDKSGEAKEAAERKASEAAREKEEHLSWAEEKAKEGYEAAKDKAGEKYEAAKEAIASNLEAAKEKSREIKDDVVLGRSRDEELWMNHGFGMKKKCLIWLPSLFILHDLF